MAAADANDVLVRAGGRLFLDPTDMDEDDMGGTPLGIVGAIRARPNVRTITLPGAERNAGHQDLYGGEDWNVSVVLQQWDEDVKQLAFPNTVLGGDATRVLVDDHTGSRKPGMPLPAYVLLFVPWDRSNAPTLAFLAACPALEETAALALAATEALRFVTLWRARRSSGGLATGRVYAIGTFANVRTILGI